MGIYDVGQEERPFGLITNQPDPTPELETFNAIDLPYSWWEKLSAQASEALPEQWERNKLMLRNYAWQAVEALDSAGEELPVEGVTDTSSTIKTAAELNEQYKTDIFKLPLADYLAPDYIRNFKARQANEYILEHDGGTGFGTTLLGSVPGVLEPVNFVTTALTGPLLKGASVAKVVSTTAAESLASTAIAAKGVEVGSGGEFSAANVAAGTALGTAFGTGLHMLSTKNVKNIENPTIKEATELGHASEGIKTTKQALVNEAEARAPIEIRNSVNSAVEALAPSAGRISKEEITDSLLPKVKPEALERINTELAEMTAEIPEDSLVVFNKSNDVLEGLESGSPVLGEQYTVKVDDGARVSFAKGGQELEARVIPKKDVVEVDTIDPRTTQLPPSLQPVFNSLPKDLQAKVTTSDLVSGLIDPKKQTQALREIADMSGGKAVKFRDSITDFHGKVSEAPAAVRKLEDSELDMPKGYSEIMQKTKPDAAFTKSTDLQQAEDFMNLPDIDYNPKLTNINSVLDEVQSGIDEKIKSGFFKEDMVEFLEAIKQEDKSFQALEKIQQAYIFCMRGE